MKRIFITLTLLVSSMTGYSQEYLSSNNNFELFYCVKDTLEFRMSLKLECDTSGENLNIIGVENYAFKVYNKGEEKCFCNLVNGDCDCEFLMKEIADFIILRIKEYHNLVDLEEVRRMGLKIGKVLIFKVLPV